MGNYNFDYESLDGRLSNLEREFDHVVSNLIRRIEILEEENIETTNVLYELENKIDMLMKCQYNMLDPM